MDKFVINGGKPLKGTITIDGAKNAAVGILPAVLLAEEEVTIENLPRINDVIVLENILKNMGVKTNWTEENALVMDATQVTTHVADYDLVKEMRASYYLLGVLLAKFNKAEVALPGGCEIGQRPIDLHLKGMEMLGAKIEIEYGMIKASAPNGLVGAEIYLDVVSVGATINIMLAAVKAKGTTTILNAAKEPHIVDLANFLNIMGAKIKGAGTDTIRILGVEKLGGCTYAVIPDQIETGTIMIAVAATRGDCILKNVIPTHMEALSTKLIETGVHVETFEDTIHVWCDPDQELKGIRLKTLPYPGFPTDLQQPMTSLLTTAKGTSTIVESIFEDRFKHVYELRRMGARINVEGNRVAVVEGVDKITPAKMTASDLRAGACLMIAALMAKGESEIRGIRYIDRGYIHFEKKMTALGADFKRVKCEPNPDEE